MPVEKLVKWHGNTKAVSFRDPDFDAAVGNVQCEEPPGEVGPVNDWPDGNYAVLSRSTWLQSHERRYWHVRLDSETGAYVGPHNCDRLAANPHARICRHIALAWLCWQQQRIRYQFPFLEEGRNMAEPTTALAIHQQSDISLARWQPTEDSMKSWLALADVIKQSEGHSLPKGFDSAAKIATVMMAADAIGLEPRSALLTGRVFLVNGKAQLDGQAMVSLVAKYGGHIEWLEMGESSAKGTIRMPGKPPFTHEFTYAMAEKALLTKSQPAPNWVNDLDDAGNLIWLKGSDGRSRPKRHQDGMKETNPYLTFTADMLAWKCAERLVRFGAPEVLNGIMAVVNRPLQLDFEDLAGHVERLPQPRAHEEVCEVEMEEGEWNDNALPADYEPEPDGSMQTQAPADSAVQTATSAACSPTLTPASEIDRKSNEEPSRESPSISQSHESTDEWSRLKDAPYGMSPPRGLIVLTSRLHAKTGTLYDVHALTAALCKALGIGSKALEGLRLTDIEDRLTGA